MEQNSDKKNCNVFRLLRIAHDMTVPELAEKSGVAASFIRSIEAETKQPSLDTVAKIGKVYHLKASTIVSFIEDSHECEGFQKGLLKMLEQICKLREKE